MKNIHLVLFVFLLFFLFSGSPVFSQEDEIAGGVVDMQKMEGLEAIQSENEKRLIHIPAVVGIGIGFTKGNRDLGFIVYVERITDEVRAQVSGAIEGAPVLIVESGRFEAY